MIDHAVIWILKFFYFEIHQMTRKLGSRSASIDRPPDNTVIFTFFVQFNHADGIFRLNDHIAEILTASRNQKKLAGKIRYTCANWLPFLRLKILFYQFYFFRFYTIRKVSTISLMPSLLPSVIRHADKFLYKFCI